MTKRKGPAPVIDLSHADKEHLVCRDLMHAWSFLTDMTPHREERKITTVTRILSCLRCETQREDTYRVPTFERVRTRYVYPEGYLVHQGGHVPVQDVRREVWHRISNRNWSN
jgi:hypothetical protein